MSTQGDIDHEASPQEATGPTPYKRKNVELLNYFFSEHWIGLTVYGLGIGCIFIFLASLAVNLVWWLIIGLTAIAALVIFSFFRSHGNQISKSQREGADEEAALADVGPA